jgi:hypothetical protein
VSPATRPLRSFALRTRLAEVRTSTRSLFFDLLGLPGLQLRLAPPSLLLLLGHSIDVPCAAPSSEIFVVRFFLVFVFRGPLCHRQGFKGRLDDVLVVGVSEIAEDLWCLLWADAGHGFDRGEQQGLVGFV